MEKDKKSGETNLVARSILFSGLSIVAIAASLYLLYFVLFFSVVSIGSFGNAPLDRLFVSIGVALISLFLVGYTIRASYRNGRKLWAQWQRKQAIDAEKARVLRLMDDASTMEDIVSLEKLRYSQKKQAMP
jgi:hypothetical protein